GESLQDKIDNLASAAAKQPHLRQGFEQALAQFPALGLRLPASLSAAPAFAPPPGPAPAQAFTETSSTAKASGAAAVTNDRLKLLSLFDTVIIIDDSPSMRARDGGRKTRWDRARDVLAKVADKAAQHDKDGIKVCFLNKTELNTDGIKDSEQVLALFDEAKGAVFDGHYRSQGTPTKEALRRELGGYVQAVASDATALKPLNVIVITDGRSNDDFGLIDDLKGYARSLDEANAPLSQLGVQFFQVGKDETATKTLEDIDNNMKGVRDMCDTRSGTDLTPELIFDTLLGAISRRIDNNNTKAKA
ncbi:MAG TPA: VWA domain-containing protein, partial [Myxococcota bacterium]|nr:VWA domain-containing protein [Myxococcota bacterium]